MGRPFVAGVLLLCAAALWAGEPPTWEVPRLEGPVRADGVLDEPQYERAFRWDGFVEVEPRENAPTAWRTELLLFSTSTALVVGVRCHDPEPTRIHRERFRRDEVSGTDAVELTLDPTGEAKQAIVLVLTPENDVTDGLLDLASGDFSRSFDLVFEHGARLVPDGWEAELVVPFSSLSFAPSRATRMLLALQRYVPREDWMTVAMLPYDLASEDPRDGMAYVVVNAERVRAARSWHLLPEWVGSSLDEKPGERTASGHLGLTLQWQPRQDTLLKATWRPDFSQVEADDTYQKINNRYPVYIREKRPFFLEGAESFVTPLRLFYSRNIVQPEWGVRLSHRGDRLGLFAILAEERDVPAERFGQEGAPHDTGWAVLRGTWALGSSGSFIGATATLRRFGSSSNRVIAVDGVAKGSRLALNAQLALSRTTAPDAPAETGVALRLLAGYRFDKHWKVSVATDYISPEFRADAGFVVTTDRRLVSLRQEYTYVPKKTGRSVLRGLRAALGWTLERTTGGDLTWRGVGGYAVATLPHQLVLSLVPSWGTEGFAGREFPDVWSWDVGVSWRERQALQPFVSVHRGHELLYGSHPFAGASRGWRAGVWSNAGPWQGELSRAHYSYGDGIRRQDSWQVSATYVWSERWSAKIFWVQDRLRLGDLGWATRSRFVNALLQYRLNPFSAVYVGANLSLAREGDLPLWRWSEARQRQVFVKASWYF